MSIVFAAAEDEPEEPLILQAPVLDLVRAELLDELPRCGFDGVVIAETRPNPVPELFVQIEAGTDSGISGVVVDHWTLVFQVWATERDRGERLAAYVAALVRRMEGRKLGPTVVYSAETTTPRLFPDPESRALRRVFSARIICRAISV